MATLEHMDSQVNLMRGSYQNTNEPRTTLLCFGCNQEKAREEMGEVVREISHIEAIRRIRERSAQ